MHRSGSAEGLQRIEPPAAEVGGEQIGLVDLEPGLQSQLALPVSQFALRTWVVNGFPRSASAASADLPSLVSSASSSREIIDCTWGR